MLAFFRADLPERLADVLLEFFVILDPLQDEMLADAPPTPACSALKAAVGLFGLAEDGLRAVRDPASWRSSLRWFRW